MRFHFRITRRPGPFRFTLSEKGLSWGLKVGRWSWNPRTRRHTIDTPGIGSVQLGGRRQRRGSGSTPATRRSPILGLIGLLVALVVGYAWLIGALPW